MAQHDYVIDNSTGANVRADINNALLAISSNNSGSSAPSTTYALQTFANTTTSRLQLRNAANNDFVDLRGFDGSIILPAGSNSACSLSFDGDPDTGIFASAGNTFNVATGGIERMELGTTTIFNEDGEDVDFRIEGDSEVNLFYVDAGNDRIGLGTSSPDTLLHLAAASNGAFIRFENTDTTVSADQTFGGLEFESRDASSGSAGVIAKIDCISTAAFDGTSANGGELRFHTSGTNSISLQERIRVDAIGNVGIGTSNPSNKVEIVGGTGVNVLLNAATHDASTANQARLQLGFVHSGGQALGHIKLDEADVNSFDGIFRIGVPFNSGSGSTTKEVVEVDFNGNLCLPGSTTAFDTTPRTSGLQLHYETDSGIATIASYSSGGNTQLNIGTNASGGAIATAMTITSSGQVGVGTTSISDKFTIGDGDLKFFNSDAANNHRTTFIEFTNSSNRITSESNYGSDGSSAYTAGYKFTTKNFTGSAFETVDAFNIQANGNVGVNTTSPATKLDVFASGNVVTGRFGCDSAAAVCCDFKNTITSGTAFFARFIYTGSECGNIQASSTGSTAYNTSSDYRLKENEVEISDGITRIKTLKPYRFNWKKHPDLIVDGFFAHEVTAVPEAITGTKDEVATEDNDKLGYKKGDPIYQNIDQSKLVPLLTAALKEAIGKIEVLETKVAALEAA